MIESVINDVVQRLINDPPRTYNPGHDDDTLAHPSMAAQCARKIWYQMYASEQGLANMPMITGTLIHAFIGECIKQLDQGFQVEVPIDLRPKYPIIGVADITSDNEVADLKTTSSQGLFFRKREGKASKSHILQAGIYAWALGKSKIVIIYISREKFNTLAYGYNVADYLEEIKLEMERLTFIRTFPFRPNRELPDGRVLQPLVDWECKFCNFRRKCLKGEDK